MKRFALLTFPMLLLFFTGCADQATAPDLDITASYAKGGKPGKPPPDDPDPPPGDAVDPTILFAEYGGRKLGYVLFQMDADGNRAMALSGGEPIQGTQARWAPNGAQFVFTRGIPIRKAPSEHHIMIGTLDPGSGDWGVQRLQVSENRAFYPDWSPQGWILFNVSGNIWTIRPDGSGETQVTFDGDVADHTLWSRDGTGILAHVHDGTAWSLRYYDVDCGSGVCAQTGTPTDWALSDLGLPSAGDVAPLDWAHTTDEVICAVGLPTGWDLAILDLSSPTPSLTNLTNSGDSGESQAAWSHDDGQIVQNRWTYDNAPALVGIRDLGSGSFAPLAEANLNFGIDWRPNPPAGG